MCESEWKHFVSAKAWENVKETLTEKMRTCYERFLEDVSLEDIAEEFNVSRKAIQVYCSRIEKQILREINKLKAELS